MITPIVLNSIGKALAKACQWGLEVEVIASSFKYLKDNPEATIEEALKYGLSEWIK